MRIVWLIVILSFAGPVSAEYTASEILFIPWGEGPNELEIWEACLEYHDGPDIDTIGHLEAGGGPSKMFVDREENIYFMSYAISYLKGFDPNGNVIVNYSQGRTEFNNDFFSGMFINFYVDSLGRIYCGGDAIFRPYVAVVDRSNNLLDRLNPFGVESGIGCSLLDWGSADVLTFLSFEMGQYTYSNGQFYEGGSTAWYARDGYYYSGRTGGPSSIKLIKMADPDTAGRPASADTSYIPYEPGNLISGGLIGVDDSMRFYMEFLGSTSAEWGVRVYNENLDLVDEFRLLPRQENQYLIDTPYPFLRHDGNVYEFHCRDDGMHVFRWSKQ